MFVPGFKAGFDCTIGAVCVVSMASAGKVKFSPTAGEVVYSGWSCPQSSGLLFARSIHKFV
jgi:hypothetical protein